MFSRTIDALKIIVIPARCGELWTINHDERPPRRIETTGHAVHTFLSRTAFAQHTAWMDAVDMLRTARCASAVTAVTAVNYRASVAQRTTDISCTASCQCRFQYSPIRISGHTYIDGGDESRQVMKKIEWSALGTQVGAG